MEVGAGHVMRCLALAQAWQDVGGDVKFVSRSLPEPLRQRLTSEGMEVLMVDQDAGSNADAETLVTLCHQDQASAVAVDGYTFDADYLRTIADGDCVSLTVDDHVHLDYYPTDFVLNQNAGVNPAQYTNRAPETELLLGPEFALLRREFSADASSTPETKPAANRILVSLGGSDPHNTTEVVIEGLRGLSDSELQVRVIVGSLNPFADRIEKLCDDDDRFRFLTDVQDMSAQYRWADFAIAAGGSSNWEMCPAGVPRVMIVIADNQKVIAEYLHESMVGVNLGDATSLTGDAVRSATEPLLRDAVWRQQAAEHAVALVDGQGAARCVERIQRKAGSAVHGFGAAPDQ